jgi:hypothetical protein
MQLPGDEIKVKFIFGRLYLIYYSMMIIKKISNFLGQEETPITKKKSIYKPSTRFEMVRQKSFIYPVSVADKIVFISNREGTGFRKASV